MRAVDDALHHSSLSFLRALGIAPAAMHVEVTIGVQKPEQVDASAVKAALPHGQVTVKVVKGGLDVVDDENRDVTVIASAAIAVRVRHPGPGQSIEWRALFISGAGIPQLYLRASA